MTISDGIIANFLLIMTVKQFRESVKILIKLRRRKIEPIFGPPSGLKAIFGRQTAAISLVFTRSVCRRAQQTLHDSTQTDRQTDTQRDHATSRHGQECI